MKPCALKLGDTVALVSPASPVSNEKLEAMIGLLGEQGYRVKVSKHALDKNGYLAGSDKNRAEDLQRAFADPTISAVICTRGGYGSARILPHLDIDEMAGARKLFGGFSDITSIHLALNNRGLPTLHSPMALTLHYPRAPWVVDSFLRSLKGDLTIPSDAPHGNTIKGGIAEGVSAGGCMCLLTDAIGTPDAFEPEGKILFLEDVDEAPHRIDAMLTHLKSSGILDRISGLVVGEMTRTDEKADQTIGHGDWKEIFRERLRELNIPSIIDFPFGHAKNMLTLGLGVRVELNADLGTVRYLESICS
jgi:muramoyltetrapeptide carboxypeptidase